MITISHPLAISIPDAEEHRPIAEIVEELYELEDEAKAIDKKLKDILKRIGY